MQGQSDLELNDIGKNQAIDVKNKLKEKNIDIILVSPLKRAQQTAIIINKSLNKKIITDKRLIEMNYGSIEVKDFRKDRSKDMLFIINSKIKFVKVIQSRRERLLFKKVFF